MATPLAGVDHPQQCSEPMEGPHHPECYRHVPPSSAETAIPFLCPKCGTRGTTDGKASTTKSDFNPLPEPVVWRWRRRDGWDYRSEPPDPLSGDVEFEALYAARPASGKTL